jgi:acyl-CoA thioester hydrolase
MWNEGFGVIVKQHRIQYLQEARLGDELEISTWIGEFRRATALRHFVISRPGEKTPVAVVHTRWVWVYGNDRRRSLRLRETV